MSVLASLITALERANGDRLVLCSGETPHVVAAGTRHDLGTTKASVKAVEALIQQILSPEARQEFAATNAALEPLSDAISPIPLVVGTHRSGDTVRIELRRLRPAAAAPTVPASPPAAAEPGPVTAPEPVPDSPAVVSSAVEPPRADHRADLAGGAEWQAIAVPSAPPEPVLAQPEAVFVEADVVVAPPEPAFVEPDPVVVAQPDPVFVQADPVVALPEPAFVDSDPVVVAQSEPVLVQADPVVAPPEPAFVEPDPVVVAQPEPVFVQVDPVVAPPEPAFVEPDPVVVAQPEPAFVQSDPIFFEPEPVFAPDLISADVVPDVQASAATDSVGLESAIIGESVAGDFFFSDPPQADPSHVGQSAAFAESEPDAEESSFVIPQLKVVPIAAALRSLPPPPALDGQSRSEIERLEYLIGHAAKLDATDLYLRAGHAPVLRVRQKLQALGDAYLDRAEIDTMAVALAAGENDWSPLSDTAWMRELEGIGRATCQKFIDDSGAGLVVHLSRHAASVLCKDIPRQVRRACEEDDGLVIVSAPALPEVMQMVAALGEWTAKRRSGYLVSIEPPTGLGHEISGVLVSTRRIAGTERDVAGAIRRALHEGPDVLVIALASGLIAEEAIRAAQSGCLVIAGAVAPSATGAIDTFLGSLSADAGRTLRQSFAASFRCGFSYRSLPGRDGARAVVQDLVIGTADVRACLERGDLGELESLQRSGAGGMRSLDAALAGAVHRRETTLRRAAGLASDRRELVRLVRRAARERNRAARGPSGRRGSDSAHAVAGFGA